MQFCGLIITTKSNVSVIWEMIIIHQAARVHHTSATNANWCTCSNAFIDLTNNQSNRMEVWIQLHTYPENIRMYLFSKYVYLCKLQALLPIKCWIFTLCVILSKLTSYIFIVLIPTVNCFQMQDSDIYRMQSSQRRKISVH
jgi:hypothetical protein